MRVKDARALLKSRNASGCYLASCAVECALEACIAKRIKAGDWPPNPDTVRKFYTHDLSVLLKEAGMFQRYGNG